MKRLDYGDVATLCITAAAISSSGSGCNWVQNYGRMVSRRVIRWVCFVEVFCNV